MIYIIYSIFKFIREDVMLKWLDFFKFLVYLHKHDWNVTNYLYNTSKFSLQNYKLLFSL
jgi:hypothetical protein